MKNSIVENIYSDHISYKKYNGIEKHYWGYIKEVEEKLIEICAKNNYNKVLEIGADNYSFPIATAQINCKPCKKPIETFIMDIDKDVIPTSNASFDFGYCRHTFEDIQNPDFAFNEFVRVAKSGYVETPSPLIEFTRNVDAGENAKLYRGYIHHRYFIWTDISDNSIHFLPKMPMIEYMHLSDKLQNMCLNLANDYPIYWNNYYMWDEKNPPKCIIYKNGLNFNIITDYANLVTEAILKSIEATNHFAKKNF